MAVQFEWSGDRADLDEARKAQLRMRSRHRDLPLTSVAFVHI